MDGRVGTFLGNPLVLQINYLGSSMIVPFLLDVSECLNQAKGEVQAGGGSWPPPWGAIETWPDLGQDASSCPGVGSWVPPERGYSALKGKKEKV